MKIRIYLTSGAAITVKGLSKVSLRQRDGDLAVEKGVR